MNKQILNFTANEQILTVDEPIRISTNKVNYIEARFDLGQNWTGYDSIRAVWFNDFYCISTVLDSQGVCLVPFEVLKRNGKVKVNLVGSISENDVLTDRLTSYPIVAVIVDCTAQINGAETAPTTPSQFEQYVAIVRGLVDSVKDIDHIELNSDYTLTIYYSDGTSDTTGSVRGATGATGVGISDIIFNSNYTLTIKTTDGNQYTTGSIRGATGATGATGNGISNIAKTSSTVVDGRTVDTYTVTMTDGTSTLFEVTNGKDGEVTLSQLYAVYPTDSASGDIASFPDGADDVPMLSVVADIEPIQDLHGYDKPWSAGAGKQKINPSIYEATISDASGISTVNNGDGTFTFNGTATANVYIVIKGYDLLSDYGFFEADTSYTLSGNYSADAYLGFGVYGSGTDYWASTESGATMTFSASDLSSKQYRLIFFVRNGTTLNNVVIKPMICKSSESNPTTYSPYSNICPIYGHTEEVVSVSPTTSASDATTYTTQFGQTVYGGSVDLVSGVLTVDRAMVDLGTLSWSYNSSNGFFYANVVGGVTNLGVYVMPNILCSIYKTDVSKYGADFPSAENAIVTWSRDSSQVQIKDTAYTDATAFKTAMNGVQLCYELATPTTIQLTPQEIDSFKGQNNLWASTGEIEVEYRADIGLYIANHGGGTYDTWQGGSY